MKTVLASVVFGVAIAADAEANLEALKGARPQVYPAASNDSSLHAPYYGQNSNRSPDPDIKRQLGLFASPENKKIDQRFKGSGKFWPKDHIPKKERNRIAAIRDEILAYQPDYKPLFEGSDIMEPVDYATRKFQAPVFLVDPKFTRRQKPEEKVVFTDNDHAGHNEPVSHSKWPLIEAPVKEFFGVGDDCTCDETAKEVLFDWPHFEGIAETWRGPVWEPQYGSPDAPRPKKQNQKTMYKGHDFGGHNIPFPHPKPPTPEADYEDAFVDLVDVFFKNEEVPKFKEVGVETLDFEPYEVSDSFFNFGSVDPSDIIADIRDTLKH